MNEDNLTTKKQIDKILDIFTYISTLSKAVTSTLIGITALLLTWWIIEGNLRQHPVIISDLNIPPDLQSQGYSPEVIVRRLLDEIMHIRNSPNYSGAEAATFEGAPRTPPPTIQSIAGLSLSSVNYAVQGFVGRKPMVVQGEIISIKTAAGQPIYSARIRLDDRVISEREGRFATPDLNKLIKGLAFDLYRHFDPLHAALAAWNVDDLEAMQVAIRQLISSSKSSDRKYGLMLRSYIGNNAMAEADLKEALRVDPSFVQAIALLSVLELRRDNYEVAYQLADQAIDMAPDRGFGYYAKGRVQRSEGHFEAALSNLKEGCKREPRLAACYNQVGEVLLELSLVSDKPTESLRSAYEWFLRATKVDESYPLALSNASWTAASFGDLSDALYLGNSAIEMDPKNALYRLRQAWVLKRKGDYHLAIEYLKESLRLKPTIIDALDEKPWDRKVVQELVEWQKDFAKQ